MCLYPHFFTFWRYPLFQETWELRDPVTGLTTIDSGLRLARHELLYHGNLLWSSLKSFGVPLLSNDVQAAILYPLTLLLSWLPEFYFWNAFVCCRLLLIGMFTYLLSVHLLKMRVIGAWVFTLTFAYALYVLRWINHPWQNGLLAGLCYLYFLTRLLETGLVKFSRSWCQFTIGLTLGAYSLFTCGFPESAAMSVLLCLLVMIPVVLTRYANNAFKKSAFLSAFLVSHVLATMLASPVILALLEGIKLTGKNYRNEFGAFQYDAYMPGLDLLTRLTDQMPKVQDLHFFNLIPLYLFLWGILSLRKKIKSLSGVDYAALLCMIFYLLKLFPVWPWFNQFVGSLPLLRQCWFTVYFMPIFLWGFSYFAATGAERIFYQKAKDIEHTKERWLAVLLFIFISILFLYAVFVTENFSSHYVGITGLLFAIFAVLLFFAFTKKSEKNFELLAALFILVTLCEVLNVTPRKFRPFEAEKRYFWEHQRGKNIQNVLSQNGLSSFDMRESSAAGDYTNYGIATIDNGNPPILPYRLRRLRQTLFHSNSDQEGYSPLLSEKIPNAWQLVGKNLSLYGAKEFLKLPKEEIKNLKPLGLVDDRYLLKDTTSLNRAYLASKCSVSQSWEDSTNLIKDSAFFKLGNVIVEEVSELESRLCSDLKQTSHTVKVLKDTGTAILLEEVKGPGVLVLNDTYYPGWRVTDLKSGKTLPIRPANLAFKAVLLPESNEYVLEFMYEPAWLFLSKVSVVLALIGVVILLLLSHDKTDFFRRTKSVKLSE